MARQGFERTAATTSSDPMSLEDRADAIAEAIGEWIKADPNDWRATFTKLKAWAHEVLEKHEVAKSRQRNLRALADDLGRRQAAVSGALTAVLGMGDQIITAITESHSHDGDYRIPPVFLPERERMDGPKAVQDAEVALRYLMLGLSQAMDKLRADPSRVRYADRELRRDLALMARPWIPAKTAAERWRALAQINALAGLNTPDPDDNRTKFHAAYGGGWLDCWFE